MPYRLYVGKEIVTKRESFLYETRGWRGLDVFLLPPQNRLFLAESLPYDLPVDKKPVPAGTRLMIKSVKKFVTGDTFHTQAEGILWLAGSEEETTFFYNWAFENTINTAPWEDLPMDKENNGY